jgi:hypothetical protein
MTRTCLPRILAVLTVLGAGTETWAANPYLKQAREKYQDLDYQALPALLAEAVQQPDNTKDELVEIYRLQGFAYTVLGDVTKSREAYWRLLVVDPDYQMEGSVSPRFRGAFTEAKKEFTKNGAVTLEHTPATVPLKVGVGPEVRVVLKDTYGRVATGVAHVRAVVGKHEGAFVAVALPSTGYKDGSRSFQARLPDPAASIPGEKPAGYFLEYKLEFKNPVGDVVPVTGGKPLYRVTVGDPVAASAGPLPRATVAAGEEGGGGGPPLWPLLAVAGGAGAVVVVILGAVLLVGAGTATAGVAAGACYLEGTCNPSAKTNIGRATVVVRR